MNNELIYSETESVCPECLKRITAQKSIVGDRVYLVKECPDHGEFRALIWKGEPGFAKWTNHRSPSTPERCATVVDKGCPYDCGLCPDHRQQTCCVLLEITQRCNLNCPVCFASSGCDSVSDPSLQEIEGWYRMLMESGGPYNIQLSGGEPTMRDDLPEIIALGRSMGFEFIQLNTNGLLLAQDSGYVKRLAGAGLNCVFLQFDGTDDSIFREIRGRDLLDEKIKAIEHCKAYGIGVVLVPTIVPDVNTEELGEIIRFAAAHMPTVRGVHFQPISYFGRYPGNPPIDRITIPEMLSAIEKQTNGAMTAASFVPPGGEHARCSFHGNFILMPEGNFMPSTSKSGKSCCSPSTAAEGSRNARRFVAKQWSSPGCCSTKDKAVPVKELQKPVPLAPDTASLDSFLERAGTYTLAISGMLFQDAWTLDLERLKDCLIHVVSRNGKLIPFCAYNLTGRNGRSLYR